MSIPLSAVGGEMRKFLMKDPRTLAIVAVNGRPVECQLIGAPDSLKSYLRVTIMPAFRWNGSMVKHVAVSPSYGEGLVVLTQRQLLALCFYT